jgi:hypothetical protein
MRWKRVQYAKDGRHSGMQAGVGPRSRGSLSSLSPHSSLPASMPSPSMLPTVSARRFVRQTCSISGSVPAFNLQNGATSALATLEVHVNSCLSVVCVDGRRNTVPRSTCDYPSTTVTTDKREQRPADRCGAIHSPQPPGSGLRFWGQGVNLRDGISRGVQVCQVLKCGTHVRDIQLYI